MLSRIMIFLGFLLICTIRPSQATEDSTRVMSEIVCENAILKIKCSGALVLQIKAVDYNGITGTNICPSNNSAHTTQTECVSDDKTSLVKSRCDGETSCNLHAASHIFGDPCPGIKKYLEVFFTCVEAVTTTSDPTTNSPTTQQQRESSPSQESISEKTSTVTMESQTSSPRSTANQQSVMESLSGQTTTEYHKPPQPFTTPLTKREVLTFNPANEPALDSLNDGNSMLCGSQNAKVVFLSALLLAACQTLLQE